MLVDLYHRGPQGAGLAALVDGLVKSHKGPGAVTEVFNRDIIAGLNGTIAVGHTRYTTVEPNADGKSPTENLQPIHNEEFALAHNGQLNFSSNVMDTLFSAVKDKGFSDSRLLFEMIKMSNKGTLERRIADALEYIEGSSEIYGSYSLILAGEGKLIAIRDPHENRPLCLGKIKGNGGWVIASETSPFKRTGVEYCDDIKPGQMIIIDEKKVRKTQLFEPKERYRCVFDLVYMSRPDSYIFEGSSVGKFREHTGMQLAIEHPAEADIVVPVLMSGMRASQGYAAQSGIRFEPSGFIYNSLVKRTFQMYDQEDREKGVDMKLVPDSEKIRGKRIVLVDDSIVRGTTMPRIVKQLFETGALEVHVRIASPPYIDICDLGIDTPVKEKLLAYRLNSDTEAIREHLSATSLGYLSLNGMLQVAPAPNDFYCIKCFGGRGLGKESFATSR
ncbi:amidophosphoribosyltransferase [Candidatus Woesearchaeota archaeon]|nr:amidophosphoribosyltransferase [Candidatus Woesearchaeota archaeon]